MIYRLIIYTDRVIFTSLFKNRLDNLVVVSPDMGGIKLARSYATRLNAGLVVNR